MSVTHTIVRAYNDGHELFSQEEDVTAGATLPAIDELIPGSSTDLAVTFSFTKTKLKCIRIWADRDMTVKTNSSGSPADTISLLANKVYMWSVGDAYFANPFAGNVTVLYVTLAAGADSILHIRGIYDPT